MKKKGFTLVELLGVVVVLGIILITAVPSIIETFKNSSNRENTIFLERLYASAETYLELNREAYDQLKTVGGRVDIPIKTLMLEGLVKTLGKDPITGNTILETHTVVATKEADLTISYELYFDDTNIDSYNKTGLVLHLDAINNAGFGYNSSSTVWNDLSTSNTDGILQNFNYTGTSGWTTTGLKFDGLNDLVATQTTGFDFSTFKSGQAFTIGVTFKANTISSWLGVVSNMYAWGTGGINIQYGTAQNIGVGMGVYLNNSTAPVTNNVYNVYAVYNGSVMSLYVNGTYIGQTTYSILAGDKVLSLGCFYTTPNLLTDGTIRTVMAYNRALTLAEINANRTLDNNRYR